MRFAAPCFSGECGFCANCNDSKEESTEEENIRRAQDLSKFWGYNYIDKITMDYNSNLKKWCKKNDYRCPQDIGETPKIIKKYKNKEDPIIFKLIQEIHPAVCDDPLCQVMFVNAPEALHNIFYPSLPIYNRKPNNDFQLCGPCLDRKPTPPEISI